MHVHIVGVLGPGFGFGYAGAVFRFGGDDATHAHTNNEQVLIVFPESRKLRGTEALGGAEPVQLQAGE